MRRRLLLTGLSGLLLAGCGGAHDSGPGHPVAGRAAASQLLQLREKLDGSLSRYRDGDRAGAISRFDAARDAHYVPSTAALVRLDPQLARRVDGALEKGVPHLLSQGVPVTRLARGLARVEGDLQSAEAALRRDAK